ncbi:MAG TPA: ABC transporter ATP-binding protein [bacterium]|nr:ABC transporter ATP-binding protein [bacterium]HOL95376.1 ABC transporter ATP-binding protein [bacterium]
MNRNKSFPASTIRIALEGISLRRGTRAVLREVNFEVPAGQITVLFGPSGVGKTTCLRLIAGFERPSAGVVKLGEEIVSSETQWVPPRNRRVGFCFQEDALWPALTAAEHIQIPLRTFMNNRDDIHRRTEDILISMGLAAFADRYPAQLSGGEKRRLALARALAMEPAYLLLDEPLSSVEGPMREELIRRLRECRSEDRAILAVTHQLDEALALGDRLVILSGGRVVREGQLCEVVRNPLNRDAAQLVGYRNYFSGRLENGTLISPFGHWITNSAGVEKQIRLAAFPEDFRAWPDVQGEAIIQECRPSSRVYRVQAVCSTDCFEALAETMLETGQRARLRCVNPPAVLEDRPV